MTLPLIVLRPEPGASATVARARAAGLDVVVAPLFEVAPLAWTPPPPDDFDALLLTSANAARQAGEGLTGLQALPVVAVGTATAAAARAAGLTVAEVGDRDAASVVTDSRFARLLHLCGRERKPLDAARVTQMPVYAAEAVPAPPVPPQGVALLHSARAAARFSAIVAHREYHLVAISADALAAAGEGWATRVAAARPNEAVMLSLARPLCERAT